MSIQMGKTVDDPTRMKFETQEFYIKDADEMRQHCSRSTRRHSPTR